MLRRRFILAAMASSTLVLSACSQAVPTKISVTQAQLEQGLQSHFPKRYPVAGLLQLDMAQPRLQMQPATNQLHSVVQVQLSGPALKESFQGQMEVRFGLRYEPKDRTVRATRVEVLSLNFQGLNPVMGDMLSVYGPRIAQQALEVMPLYTVKAEDLELADTLGLEPGAITVTEQGLDVAIVSKTAAPTPAP